MPRRCFLGAPQSSSAACFARHRARVTPASRPRHAHVRLCRAASRAHVAPRKAGRAPRSMPAGHARTTWMRAEPPGEPAPINQTPPKRYSTEGPAHCAAAGNIHAARSSIRIRRVRQREADRFTVCYAAHLGAKYAAASAPNPRSTSRTRRSRENICSMNRCFLARCWVRNWNLFSG
jgi:hypothetical protein